MSFDKDNSNIVVSGGWDNNVIIWDIRMKEPSRLIYGPFICGDSIDVF